MPGLIANFDQESYQYLGPYDCQQRDYDYYLDHLKSNLSPLVLLHFKEIIFMHNLGVEFAVAFEIEANHKLTRFVGTTFTNCFRVS